MKPNKFHEFLGSVKFQPDANAKSLSLASRLRQTANVRLKFPVYQKLVKFIWFQLMFYLLITAMEQVLKTEK